MLGSSISSIPPTPSKRSVDHYFIFTFRIPRNWVKDAMSHQSVPSLKNPSKRSFYHYLIFILQFPANWVKLMHQMSLKEFETRISILLIPKQFPLPYPAISEANASQFKKLGYRVPTCDFKCTRIESENPSLNNDLSVKYFWTFSEIKSAVS